MPTKMRPIRSGEIFHANVELQIGYTDEVDFSELFSPRRKAAYCGTTVSMNRVRGWWGEIPNM